MLRYGSPRCRRERCMCYNGMPSTPRKPRVNWYLPKYRDTDATPTQGDGLGDVKQGCWAQPFWTSNMAPTGTQGYPTRGGGPHETPPTSPAGARRLGAAELFSE